MAGYREKPDLWGEPLKTQDMRATRWSLVAILIPNMGLLASHLLRDVGWHVGADVIMWLAVALCFACAAAGFVAYREARKQVKRDIDDMMPPQLRR